MARSKQEITQVLSRIDNLPTLPAVASELLKMLGDINVSMAHISRLMTNDPAITAKVLKIANSAYYSLRKQVDTLRMALVVLGVNEITNIIVGLSLVKLFSDDKSEVFNRSDFWKHNVYTAHFSKAISKAFALPYHGEEFTAGLMHDIGKIIQDQYFHDDFIDAIVTFKQTHGLNILELEKSTIGATHQELGLWLAEAWKIPGNIQQVIHYHHLPQLANAEKPLVCVVDIANLWANYICDPDNYIEQFNKIEQSYSWLELSKNKVVSLEKLKPLINAEIHAADDFINQMESN